MAGINTTNTILSTSATAIGTYTDLVEILDYPDLGSVPNKLDTTTLSAIKFKTSILGLQELPDLTFTALYDKAKYTTISAITGTQWFKLSFGASGVDGVITWSGKVSVFIQGKGIDEVRTMQITLSAETEIEVA